MTKPGNRHGLSALRTKVRLQGMAAIDWRSAGARDLAAWRAALIADLGGAENLSTQQQLLVELATRKRMYLDQIDCFLLELPSILVGRVARKKLHPLAVERSVLDESLQRTLERLGLERVPKKVSARYEVPWAKEPITNETENADTDPAQDSAVEGKAEDH